MSKPTVFYAALSERAGAASDMCFNALMDVAEVCGANGFHRLRLGYSRTDYARNSFVQSFLDHSERDNDLLVMLDGDHNHPADIVARFAAHDPKYGVVGALAYRRGEPYDPLFFMRIDGSLHSILEFPEDKLIPCAIVSTSAISIRRWVLLELMQFGWHQPFFKYEYPTDGSQPSEDMYFGRICEQTGISHYCDPTIVIPHLATSWVDKEAHKAFLAANPHLITTKKIEIK